MIHLSESLNFLVTPKNRSKFKNAKMLKDLIDGDTVYRYRDGKNECLPMKVTYNYKEQYGLRNEEKDINDFFGLNIDSNSTRKLLAGGKNENFVFYTTKYGNAMYYSTDPSEPDWNKLLKLH